MEKRSFFSFRKGDFFAIVLVALLAAATAAVYLPGKDGAQGSAVQIYQDNVLVQELPLTADTEFAVSGDYTNSIVIRGGKVCIEASDCPGGDCMHSGWISRPGRSIVCLPNRVEIRISGQADVDFVVG